jgi:hypothetical protein
VKLGKRMVYEKKKEIWEKYLKMSLGWILGTIKRELNLYASGGDMLEDLEDHTKMALAYWRQNIDSIRLHGFGTYFIMICYASLFSQDMSYGVGVRQGYSS